MIYTCYCCSRKYVPLKLDMLQTQRSKTVHVGALVRVWLLVRVQVQVTQTILELCSLEFYDILILIIHLFAGAIGCFETHINKVFVEFMNKHASKAEIAEVCSTLKVYIERCLLLFYEFLAAYNLYKIINYFDFQIFSPYGYVKDVFLLFDEERRSCG